MKPTSPLVEVKLRMTNPACQKLFIYMLHSIVRRTFHDMTLHFSHQHIFYFIRLFRLLFVLKFVHVELISRNKSYLFII